MDQNLTFNVAQLMKEAVGATRSAVVVADLYRLVPDLGRDAGSADQPELKGPVRLTGTGTGEGVLVQGRLSAELTLSCVRCLEPVIVPIDVNLEEIYSPTIDILTGRAAVPEEEDRALWIDEHHILDLREVLRQDVLVVVPMHPVCREDCRGLCPTCGRNLNEETCDCVPEPDPRWAGLAALLMRSTQSESNELSH